MVDRIKRIIEDKGLHASSFADKIQVSRGAISHIMNGRNSPNNDTIQKIIKCFPDISSAWLISGEGPMYNREKNFISQISSSPLKQPTLFDVQNAVETPAIKPPMAEVETQKTESKSNAPVVQDFNLSSNAAKKIDKLIIFFNDNTFMTFVSEK